jgi:hypothetical protein
LERGFDCRRACSGRRRDVQVGGHTTRTALELTSKVFELTGARATASKYGFDLRWRNVRTHTLHDLQGARDRRIFLIEASAGVHVP